jgi:hypothetical protein
MKRSYLSTALGSRSFQEKRVVTPFYWFSCLAAYAKTGFPLGSAKNRYCGRLGAELSFFFASWWPTAHPTAAPTKPWWPAKCPATPPTAAPLRQPLASAGMLVSAKATVNTAQLRVVFISIRASVLCFTIRAVSFRSAYDGWGDRTIPKVRSNCAIEEIPAASPTRRRTWALVAGPC